MVKRKHELNDAIRRSILNHDKHKFDILILENKINMEHINFLEENNLTWINKDNYQKCQFEDEYIKEDYMFQFDDVDQLLITPIVFDQRLMVFHNAVKCIMKYLTRYPNHRHQLLRYALQNHFNTAARKKTIVFLLQETTIINNLYWRERTCLLDALQFQTKDIVEELIYKGAKVWNAHKIFQTKLEQQFLIQATKTSNWEEASKNLSLCSKILRSSKNNNILNNTDLQLYNKTTFFIWEDEMPELNYSYLFVQLWYHLFFDEIITKQWNFILPLHTIIKEYVYDPIELKFGNVFTIKV